MTEVGVGDVIGAADRRELKGAKGWTVSWNRNGSFVIKEHEWFLNKNHLLKLMIRKGLKGAKGWTVSWKRNGSFFDEST